MSQSTALLSLPLIQASQAQKHVTHNEALARLDALVQPVAADMDRTEPPLVPSEGDRHLVAQGATGAWLGQDGALAVFLGNGWVFETPSEGWRVHVVAAGREAVFDGTVWQVETAQAGQTGAAPDMLGVNATADAVNRLAVAAQATLLTHEGGAAGGDHRIKINKETSADTGSLLFQTGWSGRAEMGCAGNDAFSIRVSADGGAWTTALSLDPATGIADGMAVQQTPDDATPGRLMRADWGYGPATALAPVGLSGGTPTGGLLERGDTANGSFLKLADGTLICSAALPLAYDASTRLTATWTFPAPFVAGGPLSIGGHIDLRSVWNGCTPSIMELAPLAPVDPTATNVGMWQHHLSGMTSFQPGDTAIARVFAMGRWA